MRTRSHTASRSWFQAFAGWRDESASTRACSTGSGRPRGMSDCDDMGPWEEGVDDGANSWKSCSAETSLQTPRAASFRVRFLYLPSHALPSPARLIALVLPTDPPGECRGRTPSVAGGRRHQLPLFRVCVPSKVMEPVGVLAGGVDVPRPEADETGSRRGLVTVARRNRCRYPITVPTGAMTAMPGIGS